ncbi:MAG: hypothetical protein M1822_009294 [Bathelium mastoideum]|nr:MAG: hypothetical protein M1822_009294 [Bathelium mastoideum]
MHAIPTAKLDLPALQEKQDIQSEFSATTNLPTNNSENAASMDSTGQDSARPVFIRRYKGWLWFALCAAAYSSGLLYGLNTTIVADIQTFAIEQFDNVEKLGWLGISFPLGKVATILSFGKAFGIFDVKWLFISSLVIFEAGSALCESAPNMDALIVGRVWAGAGGAGMYLGALNILTLNTSTNKRPLYISLTGLFWGSGCILGPVIGGAFADFRAA